VGGEPERGLGDAPYGRRPKVEAMRRARRSLGDWPRTAGHWRAAGRGRGRGGEEMPTPRAPNRHGITTGRTDGNRKRSERGGDLRGTKMGLATVT
jgi:hypothetical protein